MSNLAIKYLYLIVFMFLHINIQANEPVETHHCDINTNYILTDISKDSLEILKKKVICEGDTSVYIEIMKYVPYYDYFVYSIIMADYYQYSSAYYNAYRIFDLWLKLYDCVIDNEIKQGLSFWLKFGINCENGSCKTILNDTNNIISENNLKKMDSINNFALYIPRDTIIKKICNIAFGIETCIDYGKFTECKKDAIKNNDLEAFSTLAEYAYSYYEDNGFTINEYFLFRIYNNLINKYYSDVTGGIIWHLQNNISECFEPNYKSPYSFYTSELGFFLLNLGVKNHDEFSYIPLAELYTKGIGVQQDINYAKEILKKNFSDKVTEKIMKPWLKE